MDNNQRENENQFLTNNQGLADIIDKVTPLKPVGGDIPLDKVPDDMVMPEIDQEQDTDENSIGGRRR